MVAAVANETRNTRMVIILMLVAPWNERRLRRLLRHQAETQVGVPALAAHYTALRV